jgi:hypothetical protein
VPLLSYGCGALIRDLCVGQRDVGQQVTLLNQCRDALIRHRSADRRTLDGERQY